MSSWTFERSILLNQQHIPLEKKSLSIIDPHDLGGSIEGLNLDEDLDVSLVSFQVAANVKWLAGPRGAIKVPFFWWRQRSSFSKGVLKVLSSKRLRCAAAWSETDRCSHNKVLLSHHLQHSKLHPGLWPFLQGVLRPSL